MVERWFALLLRLSPPAFRAEYGDTIGETLARRGEDAHRRGRLAWGLFVARESAGVVGSAALQWLALRPRRGRGGAGWLRPALRRLRRHPLYTAACATTLALAVAAGGTSLAVVKAAFFDPLPYEDDAGLVSLFTATETWETGPVSAHVLEDLRAEGPFTAYAAMRPLALAYSDGTSTESIGGIAVTAEFFTTLGVRPAAGRVWSEGESDAVVVTHGFWQTALGGGAAVPGRRIVLNDIERVVVGVLPADFVPPFWAQASVLLPLDMAGLLASPNRAARPLSVLARRADGVSTEQANAYLATFTERLRADHPGAHDGDRMHVVPLRTFLVGEARPALVGTAAAAALLLLIVCANVAGLSAARALAERHQSAVQQALGATRGRLLGERLVDGALLSALGAATGVWLVHGLLSVLATFQPQYLGRFATIGLDAGTALTAFAVGLGAGTISASVPYGIALAGRPASLTSTRGSAGSSGVTAARAGLVVVQVAVALVLVIGAGLLVRTLRELSDTSLGFEPAGLVTMSVGVPARRYADADAQIAFERDVVERLERVPGVTSATASVGVPIIGGGRASVRVFGREDDAARGEVAYLSLAPDFIDETGMRLVEGRALEATDRRGGPGVVVVNETAARRFWPEGGAIGARVRVGPDTEDNEWITVVGIVADIRQHGPTEAVLPTVFGSTWQYSAGQRWFTVRAPAAPATLQDLLRAAVHEVEAAAPISRVVAMETLVADTTARHRLVLFALAFYGAVASALCAFGVYAVVSLTSRLRRREYAIRMAIGAHRQSVRWLVLRQALVLGGAGVLAGVVIASGGTRALSGLLHGVAPLDGPTFATAAAGVLALAMLSAWWPARSAARVDPAETLKE